MQVMLIHGWFNAGPTSHKAIMASTEPTCGELGRFAGIEPSLHSEHRDLTLAHCWFHVGPKSERIEQCSWAITV